MTTYTCPVADDLLKSLAVATWLASEQIPFWEDKLSEHRRGCLACVAQDEAESRTAAVVDAEWRTSVRKTANEFHERAQAHVHPNPASLAYRDTWLSASDLLRNLLDRMPEVKP